MKARGKPDRWWPWLLMLSIHLVSGTNQIANPLPSFFSQDKLLHFLVFGLLATAWARILPRRIWLAALFTAAFGFIDECHQLLTPGRMFDMYDWAADVAGALTATLSYKYWKGYRNLLEATPLQTPKAHPPEPICPT